MILKCSHWASPGPLPAERSFLGLWLTQPSLQGAREGGAFEVRWLLSSVSAQRSQHSSLIISHEDNLSWETNQAAAPIYVMGFQAVCHTANMCTLRGCFPGSRPENQLCPKTVSSPKTPQQRDTLPGQPVSFLLQQEKLLPEHK